MSGPAQMHRRAYGVLGSARQRRLGYVLLAILLSILCIWPQPYIGRAKLLPQDPSSPLGSMLSSGGGNLQDFAAVFGGGRRAIDLYLTIGQSEDVRSSVIRDLKLVGQSGYYNTERQAQTKLARQVDVQSLPGGVIEVTAKTRDAALSFGLTKAYAAAIGQRLRLFNREQLSAKQTLVSLRSREASARLAQAESALSNFRRRNRVSANPEAQLGAALTVRTGLEAQLQARRVELETLKRFVGPENARLRALQSDVAGLRRAIAESVDPEREVGGPNAGELTQLSNQYFNLYRDYLFAQSVYQIYARLAEEVAVEELSGRTTATVQVIEAPHLDAWRHYNTPALALLALLALGAFFTEIYAPATGIRLWRDPGTIAT